MTLLFTIFAMLLLASATATSRLEVQRAKPVWLDGLKNGLASAMASACVKTVLQPIDAIKTAQQNSQSSINIVEACRVIVNQPGGVANFYAGLGVAVIGAMPGVALYFGVYSYCKRKINSNPVMSNNRKLAGIALSAAIGNSVASFSRVPYEVIKQKLQTKVYDSTWQALQAIMVQPSLIFPKGGIAIQMIRDVPYAIVTLLLYESLQAALQQQRTATSKKLDFFIGGTAGGIGSWVTNPMDVIKTRLQTNSPLYNGSVLNCASVVWQEGGAMAFLRGSIPRLMHKVPANAFFFLFYEVFRTILRVDDGSDKDKSR